MKTLVQPQTAAQNLKGSERLTIHGGLWLSHNEIPSTWYVYTYQVRTNAWTVNMHDAFFFEQDINSQVWDGCQHIYVPHAGFAPFYYDYLHLRNGLKWRKVQNRQIQQNCSIWATRMKNGSRTRRFTCWSDPHGAPNTFFAKILYLDPKIVNNK